MTTQHVWPGWHLSDQGIFHPLVPKERGSWDPTLRKPLSQQNFIKNAILYIYTLKRTIFGQKEKLKNDLPFQNGGQITDVHFSSLRFRWIFEKKNIFPKEFFNEIRLKIGDYKYICITEIKIWNFYAFEILERNNSPLPSPLMLIYAN